MNNLEEIEQLRAAWAAEEVEQKEREENARIEKLKMRRDRLRSGEWKPICKCDDCLNAVLNLSAPDGVCANALLSCQWWK